ncbi:DUF6303 family protein [Streptomyces sp. WZ-12]|uniref:DUF6303 family protein n=1 Tax=Streptomyces sp. WZ-12 TaxID=3030210 RepID=UPI002380D04C|nr:DUF6303 family protein [Streptomyces sp. WZ-12]
MADTFTAQMSSAHGGWCVYVVRLDVSNWPEHNWGCTASIPTPVERAEALTALGYEVTAGAEWEWFEYSELAEDSSSPVCLLATIPVRLKEAP